MVYTSGGVSKLEYGALSTSSTILFDDSTVDAAGVVLFDENIRSFIPPNLL